MKKIPLTKGQYALVDDGDFERLNKFKWFTRNPKRKEYYAYRSVKKKGVVKTVIMHRVILDAPKGVPVDHKNHNGLDNRRANLRLCTTAQNLQNSGPRAHNTSGYKGVFLDKPTGKWLAKIRANGKRLSLGVFTDKHEAARAYNKAALKHHGEFAYQNALPEAVAIWVKEGK